MGDEPSGTLFETYAAEQHDDRHDCDEQQQPVPQVRIVPLPQQGKTDGRRCDAAQRRSGFRYTDHQQFPPPGHDLGDVVRIEAVTAADAQSHKKQPRDQPEEVGREKGEQRGREDECGAEPEEKQVSLFIAPRSEQHRADHDADEAGRRHESLLQGGKSGMPENLDHRQYDADQRRQPCSGDLSERSDDKHSEVAPTQGHRVHVHIFIGSYVCMLLRFEPSFPPFEHPQQRNAHSHADDRFGKAQQAVYGRRDVGRHLRDEQDDEQRDGGDAVVLVDSDQHAEHLQHEDRGEHPDDRKGPYLEVYVGDERSEEGSQHPGPSGAQRILVVVRLQDDHQRRAGQHGPHPARRLVERSRYVDARQIGQQHTDAGDERDGRVHASDGIAQVLPDP